MWRTERPGRAVHTTVSKSCPRLSPVLRNPCGRARNVFHLGVKPEFNAVSCKLLLDDGTHDEVDIVVKAIIPFRERDATTGNRKCPGGFRTDKTRADNEDARAHPIDIQYDVFRRKHRDCCTFLDLLRNMPSCTGCQHHQVVGERCGVGLLT